MKCDTAIHWMTDGTWIASWACGDTIYGVDENDLSRAMRGHTCQNDGKRKFEVPPRVVGS